MSKLQGVISCYGDYTLFHNILENGDLGPGSNLTMENVKKIFKAIKLKESSFMKFENLIPENVLWYDQFDEAIIFYTVPQMKSLLFKIKNVKNGIYKVPFLLWVYKNKTLRVFSLKKKPTGIKDDLFHAPFMNVNSMGTVCMGNVKYGEEMNTFNDLMRDIEEKFFNSYFTHTNHNNLLKINYTEFLKENAGNKDVSFSNLLVKSNLTIENIL